MTEINIVAVFFESYQNIISIKGLIDLGFSIEMFSDGVALARKTVFKAHEFDPKAFHDELSIFSDCMSFKAEASLDVEVIMSSKTVIHFDARSILLMGEMKMGIGIKSS